MTRFALALAAGLLLATIGIGPVQALTCSTYRASCETACTPAKVTRYYAGSARRCLSSCEPRFQQCIRSGEWADLERLYGGGWEKATIF